jgi:hypothetical protein
MAEAILRMIPARFQPLLRMSAEIEAVDVAHEAERCGEYLPERLWLRMQPSSKRLRSVMKELSKQLHANRAVTSCLEDKLMPCPVGDLRQYDDVRGARALGVEKAPEIVDCQSRIGSRNLILLVYTIFDFGEGRPRKNGSRIVHVTPPLEKAIDKDPTTGRRIQL